MSPYTSRRERSGAIGLQYSFDGDDIVIEIEVTDLHWMDGSDPVLDLCAHGGVRLAVCGDSIDTEGGYCVSAAALYLLRTLNSDHNQSHRVSEHLLPCCGHDMHAVNQAEVLILGCPTGFDWSVEHLDDEMLLLSFDTQGCYEIAAAQWRSAVCAFSDSVLRFYNTSETKKASDAYARDGYNAFRAEWSHRRHRAGEELQ